MKLKRSILLFAFIVFGMYNFFMLKYVINQKEKLESATAYQKKFEKAFADYITSSSANVSFRSHILVNENFDTISSTGSFFKNKRYKLGIYLNDRQCVDCQMDALTYLNSFSDSNGIENTVIFSNYHNINELSLLKEKAKTGSQALNSISNFFPGNISGSNTPYFFLVDSSFNASSLLIHNEAVPAITEFYLQSIKLLVSR